MKRAVVLSFFIAVLLSACVVVPRGRHRGALLVPVLPPLVVLGAEPYYSHGGYYYHYQNNIWYYSKSRSGPWLDLPRDHYPNEVRFRDRDRERRDRVKEYRR